MIISRAHNKVILKLRDPTRVLNVVPTAKILPFKGTDLTVVPYGLDETRVLRNLGYEVPSPVEYQYQWSGQYLPFQAQKATTAFLTVNERAFVLNDLGTGKTLATLWAYDYLRQLGRAQKMLVVSPLSTLERTWADEIFRHFPHLSWAVLHGSKSRRVKLLKEDVDIFLVNHDGVKVLEKELIARPDINVVVIDEIASFRNANTERWKSLNRAIAGRKYVWGLTGTPTPNEPTDAWGQCKLICPERVPKYASQFRDRTMKQYGPFKWVPRADATEIVADAMQPSIRFSREQCVDLPECVYQTRSVALTKEQDEAYRVMLVNLKFEHSAGTILAVNEAVKMQKLVQIASGVVYGLDESVLQVAAPPRIAVTKEIIEQAPAKVIVFVPFRGVLNYVATELAKDFTVEMIHGGVSKDKRGDIFHWFQETDEPRVLVAQPAAMSHGLTLTAANTIIWYAPINSQEIYSQANARVTRPGQKLSQLIVNIEATPVERRIYERLRTRQKMEGLLLQLIQESVS